MKLAAIIPAVTTQTNGSVPLRAAIPAAISLKNGRSCQLLNILTIPRV